nr:immunoglobulin light chain junction region [Macaca mulatta]MOX58188.1 immunoglobulin light chain junction region [Macaca mulatta]
CVQALEFPLTF